jgi:hypothetical protein
MSDMKKWLTLFESENPLGENVFVPHDGNNDYTQIQACTTPEQWMQLTNKYVAQGIVTHKQEADEDGIDDDADYIGECLSEDEVYQMLMDRLIEILVRAQLENPPHE